MKNIRLVATDLDGTFLRNDKSISERNLYALDLLGANNVVRVVATGRNLRKVNEVIPDNVPFDYIVFSSGAGVYDPRRKELLFSRNIPAPASDHLIDYLVQKDLNFHAFWPVPENHNLWFHRGSEPCEEFERYFSFHNSYAFPLPDDRKTLTGLCQLLVVIEGDESRFHRMKAEIETLCPEIRIIRSSSPLNTGYIWLEIFHKDVSKGAGVLQLCNMLDISPEQTLGVGNDYNDIDLLEFTEHSFLTDNAPDMLKESFQLLPTNEEDAFAHVVERIVYES
jgi:Cof subfamily protein (haloacid dehalogenase superfamily)